MIEIVSQFLTLAAPAFPRFAADATVIALLFLFWGAVSDALTGKIPDFSVFGGFGFVTAILALDAPWSAAAHQLGSAALVGICLWAVNEIYAHTRGHDALGMGDVKWSVLAITAFGLSPVFWAWVGGAWVALGWMGLRRLGLRWGMRFGPVAAVETPWAQVHFAPFLFAGLLFGLALRVYG